MPIKDFIQGRTNRIVAGSTAAVGLILTATAVIFNLGPTPALLVEDPDGERRIEISTHGAIGTGTGADAWGNAGDCLKSGGGSGELMSFGECGSGGSVFGTGNVLTINQQTDNATSTGHLLAHIKTNFSSQFVQSSTGSLKLYFDQQYLRTSTGSLQGFFDTLYQPIGGYLATSTGALQTAFDVLFLKNTEADTEAELETLLTDVTNVFTNNDGALADDDLSDNDTGDLAEGSNLYYLTSRADGRYVNTSGDTMTGNLLVKALLSGGSLRIDSLKGCDTIDTSVAGVLSCGTDATGTDSADDLSDNTTSDLAEGTNLYYLTSRADARFVNISGDTMTGALAVRENLSGSTLNITGLKSCANLQTDTAGALSCNTTDYITETELDTEAELESQLTDVSNVFTNNDGTLADDDLSNNTLDDISQTSLADPGADRIVFWDDSDTAYEFLTADTGDFTITTNTLTLAIDTEAELESQLTDVTNVFTNNDGALSDDDLSNNSTSDLAEGSNLYYLSSRTDSRYVNVSGDTMTGALKVRASLSGSSLTVDALNAANCDVKATNGVLSCGTDATGSGGDWSGTGALQTHFDGLYNPRFVNISGDTMTGALNIILTGGNNNSIALETPHTMSGRILHAQDLLRSSGALAIDGGFFQDGLADCDNAGEKPVYNFATGKWTCGTDDDVPESGDFGAGVDLEADGSLSADVVSTAEMADADFGDWTCSGGSCTLDADVVGTAEMADADHGDFTYSGGVATLDADVVAAAEMADADHGDVSWTGGVASVENVTCTDCINATEIEDIYVLNTGDVVAGDLEIIGTSSGRILHAQDLLTSSGAVVAEGDFISPGGLTIDGFASIGGGLEVLNENGAAIDGSVDITNGSLAVGGTLRVSGGSARFYGGSVIIGADVTPETALEVQGTISGALLNIGLGNSFIRGNLGIGTTSPKANLAVVGTISGSNLFSYTAAGTPCANIVYGTGGTVVLTGSGRAMFDVPPTMSGYNLVIAEASVRTAGTTNLTTVQVRNIDKGRKFLSTPMSIDSTELKTTTAASRPVINTSNDDVGALDQIAIDIPAVQTTPPQGLTVTLCFRKP